MPTTGVPVQFYYKTEQEYKNLTSIDNNGVYFISDKNVIIVGNKVYSGSSNTMKYIGHFNNITDQVPTSYLTYDGLDKTNYACTIGNTNILYILDTAVATPTWVKAFDNLVTTFNAEEIVINTTVVPFAQEVGTSILQNIDTTSHPYFVVDSFEVSASSIEGPYSLSSFPEESSILVELLPHEDTPYYISFTYDNINNTVTLTDLSVTQGSRILVSYLREFDLFVNDTKLISSLYYYYVKTSVNPLEYEIRFNLPPSSGSSISITYSQGGGETFYADGQRTSWQLASPSAVDDGNLRVRVSSVDYTYTINLDTDSILFVPTETTIHLGDPAKIIYNQAQYIDDQHVPTAKLVKNITDLKEIDLGINSDYFTSNSLDVASTAAYAYKTGNTAFVHLSMSPASATIAEYTTVPACINKAYFPKYKVVQSSVTTKWDLPYSVIIDVDGTVSIRSGNTANLRLDTPINITVSYPIA